MKKNRIFFSTDVHGADSIWRKWLQIPKLYEVDILMLCGDLTGKALVPLIEHKNGSRKAYYFGKNRELKTENEFQEMEKLLAESGVYSIRCSQEEVKIWQKDPKKLDMVMKEVISNRINQWMDLILEYIDVQKIQVIVMPGNDDDFEIDNVIKSYEGSGIEWCLDRVIEVAGIETISCAFVNPTPWDTPRETSEEKLSKMIIKLIEKLNDPRKAIFNFHCPPYNTRLDLAPKLDKQLRPRTTAGEVDFIHVGSRSICDIIKTYQPLLGLHGHIHESPGTEKIGNTVVINPGSEYGEGILRGYMIEVSDLNLVNYWRIEG